MNSLIAKWKGRNPIHGTIDDFRRKIDRMKYRTLAKRLVGFVVVKDAFEMAVEIFGDKVASG